MTDSAAESVADPGPASLTHEEARARAALIEVERYDISVDLTDLLEGGAWRATSTVRFTCREPGGATFVDCVADLVRAELNGVELDLATHESGRLPLTDLRADNTLVVESVQTGTDTGEAILRSVDPQDGLVYVWSTFEPDGARRAWACFDQPDLKAVHRFEVDAPAAWTVLSNSAPDEVPAAADGETTRHWSFADTPRLSTYVVVVNAGPFFELREQRGEHSLGLYCRQSLRTYLERDAEELWRLTEQGLAFYGERFARPFAQERYDQVFVPDFGGAMENWGCVTWGDSFLPRSTPTYAERSMVANVLLHEMAHMWFGDLVTMLWWDDLWLNEAFASFASHWAQASATDYTDAWATFLAGLQTLAYRQDMGPATHPIRTEVPDVAHAFASFDRITYEKGCATLRQLMAYVSEETFVEGLRTYFREHAWGNAELSDLMSSISAASGRDLDAWTEGWLDRAGTDTLSLVGHTLLASGPDGSAPRPHALRIGSYNRGQHGLEQVGDVRVETTGVTTQVELPEADMALVNDGDLTFAAVRGDEASLQVMLTAAGQLPEPVSRAVAVTTAWDMLLKGELSTGDFLDCVLGVLAAETSPGVVESFLALALSASERWSPTVLVPRRLGRLANIAAARAQDPDLHTPALRTLAAAATSDEHFALLDAAGADDVGLAWLVQVRRAALGRYDADAVAALLARDPDPDAHLRGWEVEAAQPTEEAKSAAWDRVWRERSVPAGQPLAHVAAAFWRPAQHDLLVPWAHRYLDEVTSLSGGGLLALGGLIRSMTPTVVDDAWLERASAIADEPDTPPAVRRELLLGVDLNNRVLHARS